MCVWVLHLRETLYSMSMNNFGGDMKIACRKYYLLFQLFLLKRFYSSAQILFHASWRSSIRNKRFFLQKKRRGVDINFALRKKTCCKKKIVSFSLLVLCYEGKIYCESRIKIKGFQKRFLSNQFGVRFKGCENMTQNRISRSSSTCFWKLIVVC